LSLICRELTASPELRLGWMQATPSPSREQGEVFFLDIPSYRTHRVLLLEQEARFKDRIRGEFMSLRL